MNAAPLALSALLLLTACEREIQDTEGRTFEIQCEKEACHLELQGEPTASNPATFAPTRSGRLLLACPVQARRATARRRPGATGTWPTRRTSALAKNARKLPPRPPMVAASLPEQS